MRELDKLSREFAGEVRELVFDHLRFQIRLRMPVEAEKLLPPRVWELDRILVVGIQVQRVEEKTQYISSRARDQLLHLEPTHRGILRRSPSRRR